MCRLRPSGRRTCIRSGPERGVSGGTFESLLLCKGVLVRVFQDPSQALFVHGPRRLLRQMAWSFAMPRAGCSFLRDATAALRSSSEGEMVDSEVVDI